MNECLYLEFEDDTCTLVSSFDSIIGISQEMNWKQPWRRMVWVTRPQSGKLYLKLTLIS